MKDLGLVRAFCCQLEAARDIFEFYYLRREAVFCSRHGEKRPALRALARMRAIAEREKAIAACMKKLCLADSRLGFHSEAESYIYFPAYFDWRIGTLDATLARLGEIESAVRAGEGYPRSRLEEIAPVMPARISGNGDLVVENGRFKVTLPALDWNNDPRIRPGWIQVHQGCHWLGDSWQWPEHPAFSWRWFHRDILGFYSARLAVEE